MSKENRFLFISTIFFDFASILIHCFRESLNSSKKKASISALSYNFKKQAKKEKVREM